MPIGTILPFVGNLTDIPQGWKLCDGSDGTPNLIGQFLQGSNSPGSFIEPGLPNIKGEFGENLGDTWALYYTAGAFHNESIGTYAWNIYNCSSQNLREKIILDASTYNTLYKDNCDTVQPPAYTVYYIIKVA